MNDGGDPITDSYANGSATGGQGTSVGGFAGENDGAIAQSFSTGTATSGKESKSGGFIGSNFGSVCELLRRRNPQGPWMRFRWRRRRAHQFLLDRCAEWRQF